MKCSRQWNYRLPVKVLDSDEIIESLSLASGADGEGIDLATNKIAEFKFSKWQIEKANG
jgi:hypothetical protein